MDKLIKGKCRTNLDDYEMIITKFYSVPNIGDRVACLYKGSSSSLKVVGITHDSKNGGWPYIIVELNK